jgi:hypothetical protein
MCSQSALRAKEGIRDGSTENAANAVYSMDIGLVTLRTDQIRIPLQ